MSQQIPPMDRASARRFGADAINGYRARRSGQGCIALEVLTVVVTAAILTHFATDLSTPTVIGLAILAFIAGNILFLLPIVGVLASILVSLFWGKLVFDLLTAYGNLFLGIVGGLVVGLLSLAVHLSSRT
ncbi:hypothetical protein [uncultured Brachybacterium sp.]|uniref:hypothetical protein n=1 Tax=uncultured Brachybacterium sp. TaxID=189680 RepID=UPI0026397033|nr:hypothetical protein [uncultured Brachybacterium sp.]